MSDEVVRMLAAYRAFVEAHGPLTDFAQNAEMVDFEIACERAVADREQNP